MVRALLIAALAAAALAIPVPVPVPADAPAQGDGAYIPAAEELKAPAEADFLGSLLDAHEIKEESVGNGVENRQENLNKMMEDLGKPESALFEEEEEEEGAAADGTGTAQAEPVSDAAIPDAVELAGVDEDGAEGDLAGENVSEPDLPVQRRVVDTGDLDTSALDTSALDTSALGTDSLDTSSLNADSLSTDSLTTALPTTNTKRSDGDIP